MKVAHVTTVHHRKDVRIVHKECGSLVKAGYDVHLVVGDGLGDAVVNSVKIHDIGPRPGSRIKRMWVQPGRALKKIIELKPDLVHFHDPELLPTGVKLTKLGFPTIYDAHEDYPRQILSKLWIPRWMRTNIAAMMERYENIVVKNFSGIFTASPFVYQRFSKQGLPTVDIGNYPPLSDFAPQSDYSLKKKQICYVGDITYLRGLLYVVQALPMVPDVRLILCGNFADQEFQNKLMQLPGWKQVEFLGWVDRVGLAQVFSESLAGIVTLLPIPNYITSPSTKMFEYMIAGLPVISSNCCYGHDIVNGVGCGICVDPTSPTQIANAIRELLEFPEKNRAMGEAGRRAILETYNWSIEEKEMLDFYQSISKR